MSGLFHTERLQIRHIFTSKTSEELGDKCCVCCLIVCVTCFRWNHFKFSTSARVVPNLRLTLDLGLDGARSARADCCLSVETTLRHGGVGEEGQGDSRTFASQTVEGIVGHFGKRSRSILFSSQQPSIRPSPPISASPASPLTSFTPNNQVLVRCQVDIKLFVNFWKIL